MLWTVTVAPGLTDAGVVNVKSLMVIAVADPPVVPDPAAGAEEPDAPADVLPQPASAVRRARAQRNARTARPVGPGDRWTLDMTPSAREELEQVSVELLLVVADEAVRSARVDLELAVLDQVDRLPRGRLDGHDLVVVAVEDQKRDVDLPEVIGEIGLGKGLDA